MGMGTAGIPGSPELVIPQGNIGHPASHLGVRAALWLVLSGLVLSALVLLTGPLRHLRDLPSRCGQRTGARIPRSPPGSTATRSVL